ncbi:unnamed protein product [Paramecium sonneborni]|uniref:Uncharacterized protein n=1 Tax=Paramecium sonneborni TaxID=65129 RepID=A0A8S1PX14_9CILI|nr:unnamed protein product [Paramecium sonneborni]
MSQQYIKQYDQLEQKIKHFKKLIKNCILEKTKIYNRFRFCAKLADNVHDD